MQAVRIQQSPAAAAESALQRLVTVYIVTGLLFLLLPGTFLGVWNLIFISSGRDVARLSPAWLQAHGHAQLFGWIGTFIIGIGYYSLSKMGRVLPFAVSRGWASWIAWTAGVTMRWVCNITGWHWRTLMPFAAALQLAGFLIFFVTVSRHKPRESTGDAPATPRPAMDVWMKLVIASTSCFLVTLLMNQGLTIYLALHAARPELPHWLDQRYLVVAAWGFPVLAVWGFNARWLPVFLGLRTPSGSGLMVALATSIGGIGTALFGAFTWATALLLIACIVATDSLRVFRRSLKPAKTLGVHRTFPLFVRGAYVWLLIAAGLGVLASQADTAGGIWGASRHALTVGFLSTMVFAIGQRVLPAFCGMRVLYSSKIMFASLALLNAGCFLRVSSEVPAYEGYVAAAWGVLPFSAVVELAAVSLFALNLGVTILLPPRQNVDRSNSG